MNKIPVFYHIPKCGGTYLFNMMRCWCNRKEKKIDNLEIKTLTLKKGGKIFYRIYSTFEGNSKEIECDIAEYMKVKNISDHIYCMIVEPDSNWTNFFKDLNLENQNLSHFIILREPYSRIKSFFNYLNQDESLHEETHGKIIKDFKNFLESYQYEDSFAIRKFLKLDNRKPINQDDYKQVLEYFKSINMQVGNMTNIVETFNKVLDSCNMFNIDVKNIKNDFFKNNQKQIRNQTDYLENRQLEDFPQDTIDFFKDRTKFDQRLYDHYANIT